MILLSYYDTGCCLHPSREFKTVSLLNSGNVEQNQGLADKAVVVLFLRRALGCHQRKQASSHRLQPQPETCNLWSSHVTWSTETTWDHLGPPGPTILQVIPIYGRIPVSFHMTTKHNAKIKVSTATCWGECHGATGRVASWSWSMGREPCMSQYMSVQNYCRLALCVCVCVIQV